MIDDGILLTEKDYARLRHLLSFHKSKDCENLELELDRASIVPDNDVPSTLVTMNSKVKFLNIQENKEMIVTIVYPSDANFSEGKISVLASLGTALIGLKEGQGINWMFPDGRTKTLQVLKVLYQPEANQDWQL